MDTLNVPSPSTGTFSMLFKLISRWTQIKMSYRDCQESPRGSIACLSRSPRTTCRSSSSTIVASHGGCPVVCSPVLAFWLIETDKTNGFLASTRRCPFETGLDASNQAIKKKRYERMRRVTNLLLQDIPSLKSFCSINPDPSSTMNKEPFLNVTHLTLGHSLTRHLGLTADGKYHDLLSTLQDSLSPTHLCVDYSSGMDKAGFYTRKYQQDPLGDYERTWLEWEFDREGLWDYIHKVGMTNVVGALMARWTRLEEVVLHGVQEQSLPISTQNTRIRVFYQDDLRGSLSNVRYGGSTFRADLEQQSTVRTQIEEMGVVVSLLAPPRCSYEFIGVGHCPRAISIELQEEEEANQNATERFWRYFEQRDLREIIEHQVLFSTRTRAQHCVCCGKK